MPTTKTRKKIARKTSAPAAKRAYTDYIGVILSTRVLPSGSKLVHLELANSTVVKSWPKDDFVFPSIGTRILVTKAEKDDKVYWNID